MNEKIFSKETLKILEDYLRRLKANLKSLPASEKEEIIKEIRSNVIMEMEEKKKDHESEIESLLSILEKIGAPEEVAEEIISRRVLSFKGNFAKRFLLFTGKSILYAFLGLFSSFLTFFLYCFGFILFAMTIVKIFFPANAGLFISEKSFSGIGIFLDSVTIGMHLMEPKGKDVLELWNIPFGIMCGFLLVTGGNFLALKLGKIGKKLFGGKMKNKILIKRFFLFLTICLLLNLLLFAFLEPGKELNAPKLKTKKNHPAGDLAREEKACSKGDSLNRC